MITRFIGLTRREPRDRVRHDDNYWRDFEVGRQQNETRNEKILNWLRGVLVITVVLLFFFRPTIEKTLRPGDLPPPPNTISQPEPQLPPGGPAGHPAPPGGAIQPADRPPLPGPGVQREPPNDNDPSQPLDLNTHQPAPQPSTQPHPPDANAQLLVRYPVIEIAVLVMCIIVFFYLRANPPYRWWRKYAIASVELIASFGFIWVSRVGTARTINDITPIALFVLLVVLSGLRLSPRLVVYTGFMSIIFFTTITLTASFPPGVLYPILVGGIVMFAIITATAAYVVTSLLKNNQLYLAAQRRSDEIETLRQAAAVIVATLKQDEAIERILQQLQRVIPYDSASLFLLDNERPQLVAGSGFPSPDVSVERESTRNDALIQALQQAKQPINLGEHHTDPLFEHWFDSEHDRNVMFVPLLTRGEIIGFILLDRLRMILYGEADAVLAQAFANQAAVAIENARLFSEVKRLATTDPLTGLANRRHFFDLAEGEIKRAARFNHPLSLIMFDIDHFKNVNDTYGHDVGDQVLRVVSNRSCDALREIDLIGRYGGEEFAVILPETDTNEAQIAAERLRQTVADTPVQSGEDTIRVTISLGVATSSENTDLDALLKRADVALYSSKEGGRNRVSVG